MSTIDKNRLRELALDPKMTGAKIFKELGFNNYATFSYHLHKDPELRQMYDDAREEAAKFKTALPPPLKLRTKSRSQETRCFKEVSEPQTQTEWQRHDRPTTSAPAP